MSNFLLCSNMFIYFLYVRVGVCVHLCVGVYVHVHARECRCQKWMSAISLSHVSPYIFLRHGLSLNPELINFGQAGWPMTSRSPSVSVSTSRTGVTEEHLHIWILPRWGWISCHHACMEDVSLAESWRTPALH